MSEERVFRIGLTMAGAISAGAYTAGVFDFLIHALAAREEARKKAEQQGASPGHRATIVAMTGASAGGMTAVLGTIALGRGLRPTKKTTVAGGTIDCVLPDLYSAWVEQVRMTAADGERSLLSLEDLDNDGKVVSLLNATLLESIRDRALQVPTPPPSVPPYSFVAETVHVYATVTNLRGTEYDISFDNDSYRYRMLNHADRKHYAISGLGNASECSEWSADDPASKLAISDLNRADGPSDGWKEMGNSALATGAFPVGLAARKMAVTQADYDGRKWPTDTPSGTTINPSWPSGWTPTGGNFGFVGVDGGVINNEPFELARYAIRDLSTPNNPRAASDADRAVIMVAPFPEGYSFPQVDSLDDGVVAIITALFPTLIQQARFKLDELVAAAHPEVCSRFVIAPRRDGSTVPSSLDIACGLLGGFGGFLDQSFREHDFQLGQRNCQQFLKKYFQLSADNAIVTGQDGAEVPIIPLHSALGEGAGPLGQQIPQPSWPRMTITAYQTVIAQIETRADKLVPALVKQQLGSGVVSSLITIFWDVIPFGSIKDRVIKAVRLTILADLIRRDQIQDGLVAPIPPSAKRLRDYTREEREVLARLADPGFDLRTVEGLAGSTGFSVALVQDTLTSACNLPDGAIHQVWKTQVKTKDRNGVSSTVDGYGLMFCRPSWFQRNFGNLSVG